MTKPDGKNDSMTSLEKYRSHVQKNLALISKALSGISAGDFSRKADLLRLPPDEFADVFRGIDAMINDLAEAHEKLKEQSRINALRAEIWKLASNSSLTEEKLLRGLLSVVGPFLRSARASYYRLDPKNSTYVLQCQWCAEDIEGSSDLVFQPSDYEFFLGNPVVIVKLRDLPGQMQTRIAAHFQRYGIQSLLALPFPNVDKPEAIFTFSDLIVERQWTPDEISIAAELILILAARTSQIRSADALLKVNEHLEKKVKKQTAELIATNEQLHSDIKERARINEALRESEERFRSVAQTAHEAIISADHSGTIVYWNPGAEIMFGYPATETVGKSMELIMPGDLQVRHKQEMKTIRFGPGKTRSGYALRKNGERFPVELSVATWETESGVYHTAILRDITERHKTETALRERERFLENVFSSIQDGLSILDSDYTIMRVNPTMERLYPHAMPLVGKKCYAAYHGRGEICDQCPTRQTLETAQAAFEITPKRGSQGEIVGWLDVYTFPLFDTDSGKLTGVIEYVRDITDRTKAQQDLADEKEFLDVTLRSIGEGVISADIEGKIALMNSSAERLTGWTQEAASGRPLDDIFHVVNERTRAFCGSPIKEVIRKNQVIIFPEDRVLISRDGSERLIAASGAPIRDRQTNLVGVVVVFRDITEQQKLEQELFKARKLESIGLLAGGIAHDFNNILTGIVTNLFMAKMNASANDEIKQLIIDAEKAAFRASRLTKQLLTFSKGGSPVKEAASIKEIIEESVGFCLSGSNVDYKLDVPDDLWGVEVDRGQIDQVLNNLVINADQAMPNGGTVTVKAENMAITDEVPSGTAAALPLSPGKYVKVSISDEGLGIPLQDLERIFDPYFTTKQEGSGLGLTTSFSIVKKHGGHITVKSSLGKGSRFTFFLPAAGQNAEDADENEQLSEPPLPPDSRILVMDDDEIVRTVVQRLLGTSGYDVLCSVNGEEAIREYQKAMTEGKRFEVVVMDLTVPGGMGGKDAVRKILEIDKEAKVIVFSGYSNDPVMANYRDYGFVGVIEKPFSIDDFLRVLSKIKTAPAAQ